MNIFAVKEVCLLEYLLYRESKSKALACYWTNLYEKVPTKHLNGTEYYDRLMWKNIHIYIYIRPTPMRTKVPVRTVDKSHPSI